jgi:hypothetical protein
MATKKGPDKIDQLKGLDRAADTMRKELGFHKPGEVLFQMDNWATEVVVEANGYGGATILEIAGSYPGDYKLVREKVFDSEEAACKGASAWCRRSPIPEDKED